MTFRKLRFKRPIKRVTEFQHTYVGRKCLKKNSKRTKLSRRIFPPET